MPTAAFFTAVTGQSRCAQCIEGIYLASHHRRMRRSTCCQPLPRGRQHAVSSRGARLTSPFPVRLRRKPLGPRRGLLSGQRLARLPETSRRLSRSSMVTTLWEVEPMLNAAAAKVAEKKSYIYMERYDELHSASPGTERSSYRPCEIFLDFPTAIPLGYTEMRPSWIPGRCPCCGTADCGQGTLCVCSPSTWCWARAPRTSGLWQPRSVQQASREQPFRARRCLTWATTRRTRTATLDLSERRRDALAHASHRSLATHLSSCVARPRRQWRGPTSSRSVPSAEPIGVTRGQLGH
jgi:hypothetical protein